jgi:hypothetical protein
MNDEVFETEPMAAARHAPPTRARLRLQLAGHVIVMQSARKRGMTAWTMEVDS